MSKTIVGSIAVILCGLLLMPLLVDTTPPSVPTPKSAAQQIAIAELARSQ